MDNIKIKQHITPNKFEKKFYKNFFWTRFFVLTFNLLK